MTDEMLTQTAHNVLKNCNIQNDMPGGQNMQSMLDITKMLLVRDISDRMMNEAAVPAFAPRFPIWPLLYYPYFGGYNYRRYRRGWDGWGRY